MATLVFDGDCGFCLRCVRFVEDHLPVRARLVAWQAADLDALGISRRQAEAAVQWVAEDGTVSGGHVAVARLLTACGRPWSSAGRLMLLPGVSRLAAWAYHWVSEHRGRLSALITRGVACSSAGTTRSSRSARRTGTGRARR